MSQQFFTVSWILFEFPWHIFKFFQNLPQILNLFLSRICYFKNGNKFLIFLNFLKICCACTENNIVRYCRSSFCTVPKSTVRIWKRKSAHYERFWIWSIRKFKICGNKTKNYEKRRKTYPTFRRSWIRPKPGSKIWAPSCKPKSKTKSKGSLVPVHISRVSK